MTSDRSFRQCPICGEHLNCLGGRHDIEVLKLGVNTTFAMDWLMPRLETFRQAHPEIDLRISTNDNRVEILREGLDMAIRFGTGGWTGHDAIPLAEAPMAPLCAPNLASRLRHPSDLRQVTLLRSYRSAEWPGWFEAAGAPCPPVTGPVFDSSVALAELAASGAGVALLPVPMFESYIAQGRLAQPFGVTVSVGRYYLAWPSDRPATSAMSTFSRWLTGQSAE